MTAAPSNITNLPVAPSVPAAQASRGRPSGVVIKDIQDAWRFSEIAKASGLLPKSFYSSGDPVAAAFCAIQLGAEVGLSPMASIQNIAVINNKPGLYGPAQLAVVEASGLMEVFEEWIEGEGDKMVAFCRVKRYGRLERLVSFSWADAVKAKLPGKAGPWSEYPKRMMQARARSFALRDTFPDVLAGLAQSVEELQDIPQEASRRVVDAAPAKVDAPPPPKAEKPPLEIALPHGWEPAKFSRTRQGLKEALEFLAAAVLDGSPMVVGMNNDLLDLIAEKMPQLADEVSELRAAAAEAMAGDAPGAFDPDPDDLDEFGLPSDQASLGRTLHPVAEVSDQASLGRLPTDPPD
jgi:hypothetical protein